MLLTVPVKGSLAWACLACHNVSTAAQKVSGLGEFTKHKSTNVVYGQEVGTVAARAATSTGANGLVVSSPGLLLA